MQSSFFQHHYNQGNRSSSSSSSQLLSNDKTKGSVAYFYQFVKILLRCNISHLIITITVEFSLGTPLDYLHLSIPLCFSLLPFNPFILLSARVVQLKTPIAERTASSSSGVSTPRSKSPFSVSIASLSFMHLLYQELPNSTRPKFHRTDVMKVPYFPLLFLTKELTIKRTYATIYAVLRASF